MLKNMPESQQVATSMRMDTKERLPNIRAIALIGIIISNCINSLLPQQLYKATLAAANINDQSLFAGEISAANPTYFIKMALESQRMTLIILVAFIISNDSRIKAPIED